MHHIPTNQTHPFRCESVSASKFIDDRTPIGLALRHSLPMRQKRLQIRQFLLALERSRIPGDAHVSIELRVYVSLCDHQLSIDLSDGQPIDRPAAQTVTAGAEIERSPVLSV